MKICLLFFIVVAPFMIHASPQSATIALAGDTMLGRLVNEVILQKGDLYPWGDLIPLLKTADLRIINLENTFTRSEQKVPKVFNFKSDPRNVQALKEAHIDVVSLANNHSKDFGDEGLLDTLKTLHKADIKTVGAGKNLKDARAPVIIKKNGIKIGILGATDNESTWLATRAQPGINYFTVHDLDQLLADIKKLKKRADIVIVSLHWGPNMRERPTQPYIDAAHKIIDAGADIIHGHSSHNFQGIETYKNKLIFYDVGDFVDDYRVDPKLRNDWSFLYMITVSKDGIKQAQLIPTKIERMQVNKANGSEKDKIIHRMQTVSKEFGTLICDNGTIQLKGKIYG